MEAILNTYNIGVKDSAPIAVVLVLGSNVGLAMRRSKTFSRTKSWAHVKGTLVKADH